MDSCLYTNILYDYVLGVYGSLLFLIIMEEHLIKIGGIVDAYNSGKYLTPEALRKMLRELTSAMYYLTTYKIEYKNQHNAIRYKHKGSIGAGEILAHEQCPGLYQVRYILRAGKDIKDSIVQEMSMIKAEM